MTDTPQSQFDNVFAYHGKFFSIIRGQYLETRGTLSYPGAYLFVEGQTDPIASFDDCAPGLVLKLVHQACALYIHHPEVKHRGLPLGDECCITTYIADPMAEVCVSCHKVEPEGLRKLKRRETALAEEMKIYFSERNIALVYRGVPEVNPVLTCELYIKWYSLYLVEPDGVCQAPIDYDELERFTEPGESAVGDHCWNPRVIAAYAQSKGWDIDELSFDLIAGRWHNSMCL